MATNNNLSNVPGAVPYISMVSDQANALMINAFNERTKQYEAQLNAIAENEALLNQMKYRDPDRAGALVKAAKISSDLDKEIQDKYAGDYAATGARKAVASRIAQERGVFSTLQQKYEEEQPYKQMYNQLKATGQLAKKYNPTTGKIEEVNPFGQSSIDTEGNLINSAIDYGDVRKKGDYVNYITENVVNPMNKQMRDLGLKYKQGPFAFTKTSIQGKQVGLSPEEAANKIDDNTAKRFLEENPTFAFEFGNDIEGAKNYIKDIVRQKATQQTDYQYGNVTDQWAMMNAKAALKAKKAEASPMSMFLPVSQESGQTNPFITERQKSGKTLQGMWKNTSMYGKSGDINTTGKSLMDTYQQLKQQRKQLLSKKYLNEGERAALQGLNIQEGTLKNTIQDFNSYAKEVAERKTNWFNQAAQSITGNPEAKFKSLSSTERKQILQKAPKGEHQWAKTFDEDLTGKTLTYRNQRPIDPDLQKYLGKVTETSGGNFRTSGGKTISQNLDDVAKDSGIDPQVLRQAIKTGEFPMSRIDATGEYAIRIPKDLKIGKTGKIDYSKMDDKNSITIYHTFDTPSREISDMLKWAEKSRFATGTPSSSFSIMGRPFSIKKVKGDNLFSVNGQLMTKSQLDDSMTMITDNYLGNYYYPRTQKKKLNSPVGDLYDGEE